MKQKGPLTCTDEANEATREDRKMTTLKAQEGFARLASALIVLAAIVLTFDGTVRFAHAHGALGWRGAAIAGMNDLAVLVGILWPRRPLQALAGLCAGFTIWANVDHAAPGPGGLAVALIPPLLAILMVAALERVAHGSAVGQGGSPVGRPKTHEAHFGGSIRPSGSVSLKVVGRDGSLRDPWVEREPLHLVAQAQEWDADSIARLAKDGMSTAEIVAHTGVPKSTVNRWKKQVA